MIIVGTLKIALTFAIFTPVSSVFWEVQLSQSGFDYQQNNVNAEDTQKWWWLTIWLLNIDCLCTVAFLRTSFSSNTGFHVFDRSAIADALKIKNEKMVKIKK